MNIVNLSEIPEDDLEKLKTNTELISHLCLLTEALLARMIHDEMHSKNTSIEASARTSITNEGVIPDGISKAIAAAGGRVDAILPDPTASEKVFSAFIQQIYLENIMEDIRGSEVKRKALLQKFSGEIPKKPEGTVSFIKNNGKRVSVINTNNSQNLIRSLSRSYSLEEQLQLILKDFESDIIEIEICGEIFSRDELEKYNCISLTRIFAQIKPLLYSTKEVLFNADMQVNCTEMTAEEKLAQSDFLIAQLKIILKFSILSRVSSDIIHILATRDAIR